VLSLVTVTHIKVTQQVKRVSRTVGAEFEVSQRTPVHDHEITAGDDRVVVAWVFAPS